MEFAKFTIICGHYGCGKTNFALNAALGLKKQGMKVTLVDLDIVNPYFRSSEYGELLSAHGVRLIAPSLANSTLESPSLPAEMDSIFDDDGYVIIDVGGDDAGATALGRYSAKIKAHGYELLYVINKYRPLTSAPSDAATLLHEIQTASRLEASALINNSHLMGYTSAQTVQDSQLFALDTAGQLGIPIKLTTAPSQVCCDLAIENLYPVEIYVKPPWD